MAAKWIIVASWADLLHSGLTGAQLICGAGEPFNICEQGPYYHKRVRYDSWLSDNTPMITEYCYDYSSGDFDGSWTTSFPSEYINHEKLCRTPPALFGSSLDPYAFDEARYLYMPNKNSHRDQWTGSFPANPDGYPMNGGVFFSSPAGKYDWGTGGDLRDTSKNAAGSGSLYYNKTSSVFYEIPDDDPVYSTLDITTLPPDWQHWAKCRKKSYGRQNMFMNDMKSYQNDTIVAFELAASVDVNNFLVNEVFDKVRIIFNGEDYCYTGENDACKADPTLSCCQQDMNLRPWWCQAANCTSDDIIYDPYPYLKTPQRQPVISINFGADDSGGAIPPVSVEMIEPDANGNRAFWGCSWETRDTEYPLAFMIFAWQANWPQYAGKYCGDWPDCTGGQCPTYGTCTEAWDSDTGAKKQTVVSKFFDRVVSNNGGWTLAHYMALAYLDRIGWNHTDVWDAWQKASSINDASYVRPDTPQKYFAVNVEAYLTDTSVVDTLSMTVLGAGSTAFSGSMYPHDRATLLNVDPDGHDLIRRLLNLTTDELNVLQASVAASRQTMCNVTCDKGTISGNKFTCECNTGYSGGGEYLGGPTYPECAWSPEASNIDATTGSPACVSNSTTPGSCPVAGLSTLVNGILDPCCNGVLSSGYSCFVLCDAGFEVSGRLPSCSDGIFDPGSVACKDVNECHMDMEIEVGPYVHLELPNNYTFAFSAGDSVNQGPSTNGTVLISSSNQMVYVAMTGGSLDTTQPIVIGGNNFTVVDSNNDYFKINSPTSEDQTRSGYFYNVPGGVTSAPSPVTLRNMYATQGDVINVTTNYRDNAGIQVYLSADINGVCKQAYLASVETNVTTVVTTNATNATTEVTTEVTNSEEYYYTHATATLPSPTPTTVGPETTSTSQLITTSTVDTLETIETITTKIYTPISDFTNTLPFTYRAGADEVGKTLYISVERYESYQDADSNTVETTACDGLAMVQVTVGSSVCGNSYEVCHNYMGSFSCSFVGIYDAVPLAAEATRMPAKYDPMVIIDQYRKVTLQARGDHGDPNVLVNATTPGGHIEALWIEDQDGNVVLDIGRSQFQGDNAQYIERNCGLAETITHVTPYLYSSDPAIGKRKGLTYNVKWETTAKSYDDMTHIGVASGPYSKNDASKPAVYRDTYLTVADRTPSFEGDWTDVPELARVLVRGPEGSSKTLHEMIPSNYIEAIWVRDQAERVVALQQFSASDPLPEMEFDIAKVTPFPSTLTPYSYGNLGGLWRGFTEEDPSLSPASSISAMVAVVISAACTCWL